MSKWEVTIEGAGRDKGGEITFFVDGNDAAEALIAAEAWCKEHGFPDAWIFYICELEDE